MLNVTVTGYAQACTNQNSGGAGQLWVGDAEDFDLTAGAPDAETSGYSAIARRAGATQVGGGNLYEIKCLEDSINPKVTQSLTDGSVQWAYEIIGKNLKMQQALSKFASKLDAAGVCGQLIWVWYDNNSKIWIAGEKYVGGNPITKFKIKQDGSVIDWGTAFNSFNGMNLSAKGNYTRPPYEFTGGIGALSAMFPA